MGNEMMFKLGWEKGDAIFPVVNKVVGTPSEQKSWANFQVYFSNPPVLLRPLLIKMSDLGIGAILRFFYMDDMILELYKEPKFAVIGFKELHIIHITSKTIA